MAANAPVFVTARLLARAPRDCDQDVTHLLEIWNDPLVYEMSRQVWDDVGLIRRLMIDHRFQHQGYGRATMIETIRRLKLHPDVRHIATSVHKENRAAESLYRALGFVDDEKQDPRERYLQRPWAEWGGA